MTTSTTACLVCGESKWISLPDPGPRSMASDWRVVDERLARVLCAGCGLVRRDPTASTGASFYASGYALYGHPPGDAREQARQDEYARWIAHGTGTVPVVCWTSAVGTVRCYAPSVPTGLTRS